MVYLLTKTGEIRIYREDFIKLFACSFLLRSRLALVKGMAKTRQAGLAFLLRRLIHASNVMVKI